MAQNWRKFGRNCADDTQMKKSYTHSVRKSDLTQKPFQGIPFPETAFVLENRNRRCDMSKQLVIHRRCFKKRVYWSMVSIICALIICIQPVMAESIWDRFSAIMRDVYGQIVAISTIVAVTVAAIALIVRMVSRNQRAVDEATSWLKRIVITWIILNTLGFIVAYLQPLIAGGQYTG